MKKVIYSMLALLCAAFAFTSCEDVPMPYDQPGEGGEDPVIVEPVGDGTLENPYNVAAVLELANSLAADVEYDHDIYIKGKVVTILEEYGTQWGNATFYISDDGTNKNQFEVYQAYYLGNKKYTGAEGEKQIQEGDDVIICGKIVNFRGTTPETAARKAFLYSLNGETKGGGTPAGEAKGSGTQADPYNPVAAINYANQVGDNESDKEVYIKGKVSKITNNYVADNFGNATFYISEDGTENNEFYCYRTLYLGNKKYTSGDLLKVGDEVVVCGKVTSYKGNTPETVANKSYLYSLNGKTGGDTPTPTPGEAKGSGTLDDPFNPVAANNYASSLAADAKSDKDVYIKGIISRIASNGEFSTQFGNATFYISEDGKTDNEFYVFRTLYLGNVKYTEGENIKVGDEVIICGKVTNYKGNTPETAANESYIYSLNSAGGGGGGETDYQGSQAGEVNENVITVQVSKFNLENQTKLSALKLTDGTTLKFDGGGNSNIPAFYTAGDGTIRMYPKNSMTINAGDKTIVEIEITAEDYNGTIYNASGNINISGATKAISDNILTYTNVNSSNVTVSNDASGSGAATQLRFKVLKITYAK